LKRLTDLLNVQRIKVPLLADSKEEAIRELIDLLAANGDLSDAQGALDAVLDRERIRTTGIGNGLAIPHGKSNGVDRPMMALGRTAEPIGFDSIDDKPVQLIALLISPPEQTGPHIQVLARACRLLSFSDVQKALCNAATAEQMLQTIRRKEEELELIPASPSQ